MIRIAESVAQSPLELVSHTLTNSARCCATLSRMTDRDDLIAELEASNAQYEETKGAHKASAERATRAAEAAIKAGLPPADVVPRSPYSDAHLRKMRHRLGVKPAKPGPKAAL